MCGTIFTELSWSEWSECSVTCGTGLQARVQYCRIVNARHYRRRQIQLHSPDVATDCRQQDTGLIETRQCTAAAAKNCPGLFRKYFKFYHSSPLSLSSSSTTSFLLQFVRKYYFFVCDYSG